jgi:predicted XRE-type DNA-binding protein
MVSINLLEVDNKQQIAKIIRKKMELNGIKKSEIILGTHLSKSTINSVVSLKKTGKDYRFGTLLKILSFLKIQLFIGETEQNKSEVLSLF